MNRALLLAASCIVLACGPGTPRSPAVPPGAAAPAASATVAPSVTPPNQGDSGVAESRETRLIARTLRRVEHARGLDARKAVPGILLDRPALIARVKSHV
jgi:hypothetical protein